MQPNGRLSHQPSLGSEAGKSTMLDDDDDDVVEERDPSGRFARYDQKVGKGRFKCVYKGFDEKQGIDIAWSKVLQEHHNLDEAQMEAIVAEMSIGLEQEHSSIIHCYRCWLDRRGHCINLITEFFTSGNLRDYRQRHKHLELKAVKKWARQVLLGLNYLHTKSPPIIHGDLRCDKIYINGHSGEIKIGDLGLATLLPMRFAPGVLPEHGGSSNGKANQYTRQVDVFAFGLVVLELTTMKRLDHSNSYGWPELLESVKDEDAKLFIAKCLGPPEDRPAVGELLEDKFFCRKAAPPRPPSLAGDDGGLVGRDGSFVGRDGSFVGRDGSFVGREGSFCDDQHRGSGAGSPPADRVGSRSVDMEGSGDEENVMCQVGTVQGEDYTFRFGGKIVDGKLHFRLNMEYEGEDDEESEDRQSRTIDFEFDPDTDTPDEIAIDLSKEFDLSSTDRDICAAALKEWLAKEAPNS
jgi:WNK lysine deficient protein kinase